MTRVVLALLWFISFSVVAQGPQAEAEDAVDSRASNTKNSSTGARTGNGNLLPALAQIAGMRVCDQMRDRFRTLTVGSRDGEPASGGTLWIEDCTAGAEGTRLSISLAGRGWRWIYRVKRKVGAEFEVSEHATFAVDINVKGNIDAAYDTNQQVFTFWFKPTEEPTVNFQPLGDVDVDTEGLWSTVVGGAASVFTRSPHARAQDELKSAGQESFEEKFAQGYTAELDFCTGRLTTGFGLQANDSTQDEQAEERGTPGYMQEGGLILDGPRNIEPSQFSVSINSDGPLRVELMCHGDAKRLARAFLQEDPLPNISALTSKRVHGKDDLVVEEDYIGCPVTVVLRSARESPKSAFGFHYYIEDKPLMEPAQQCGKTVSGHSGAAVRDGNVAR